MKEYKTMRISPDEEVSVIETLAVFGWKLEDSKEIYNESSEIVGVNVDTKVKTYGDGIIGGFMAGWNGDEGKVERNVAVLISLCTLFIGAQAEIWEIVVCVIVPVVLIPLLIVFWVKYSKKKCFAIEENENRRVYNEQCRQAYDKRVKEIVEECVYLNEENDRLQKVQ